MGMPEKMPGIGTVMFGQTQQCSSVPTPVLEPQLVGSRFIQLQMGLQVLRHGSADVGENMGGGIVQGVVQIEHPCFR